VRKRQFPLVAGGTGYSSWVHLDDAASATVLAVEHTARGVFNIVDDEPAPASEWLPYLAACAGAKRPMRVPEWLARVLAGEVAVTMMTEGRGFSNAKAKRELGWQLRYPSWRQGFREGRGNSAISQTLAVARARTVQPARAGGCSLCRWRHPPAWWQRRSCSPPGVTTARGCCRTGRDGRPPLVCCAVRSAWRGGYSGLC
jgi:hypothetical protein